MVNQVFQEHLIAAFPERTWLSLSSGLREGIRLADQVIETTPLLRFVTGQDLRGHVRRAGILFNIREMCRRGDLPFQAEAAKMPIGYWHWLDIRSQSLVAHVIRTASRHDIPDITSNRQPKYLKNEYDLFDDGRIPAIETLVDQNDERYSAITFGASPSGDLTHASIGIPSSDGSEWLGFIDLLRNQKPMSASVAPPAPQPPGASEHLKFAKHIQEMLAEQDNKENDEKSA